MPTIPGRNPSYTTVSSFQGTTGQSHNCHCSIVGVWGRGQSHSHRNAVAKDADCLNGKQHSARPSQIVIMYGIQLTIAFRVFFFFLTFTCNHVVFTFFCYFLFICILWNLNSLILTIKYFSLPHICLVLIMKIIMKI